MPRMDCGLSPMADVERRDGGFFALSREPWLRIDHPAVPAAAGRFVEITYRASLWDEPARPLFRFEQADGSAVTRVAAGPVAGAGLWTGRIPSDTTRISVSPTHRLGFFGFEIETIRTRSPLSLLAKGFREFPFACLSAVFMRLIGWRPEADSNLAWAIGSTRLADYPAWLARRRRPVDGEGLDAPRFDWETGDVIHVGIEATDDPNALGVTLASLRDQIFPRWQAHVFGRHRELPHAPADARIVRAASGATLQGAGLIGFLTPGDCLRPHALACVAEAAHRHPENDMFYGDEECEMPDGRLVPTFKPGWSPLLHRQRPFLGRGVFFRSSLVQEPAKAAICAMLDRPDRQKPLPIRRVLLRTKASPPPPGRPVAPVFVPEATAAIIIPTRDQAVLLRKALASIRRFSDPQTTRLLIVDNGSVEAETKLLFEDCRRAADVQILEESGPFNFSLLCNRAAAATDADVLVFLNNDTEALSENWLDRLKAWALRADVGAVGAKLTYPDGRLQHIGVVLGMGEGAGHFGAFVQPGEPGWAGRNQVVHEVSAVTGACLAVARTKFEAVGGFDAVNLPVDLNDIDLCLKLAERGWTSILDPEVHLLHAESVSRGRGTFRRMDVYEKQRQYFRARWRARLRDDPYFHPGLSLFRMNEALG